MSALSTVESGGECGLEEFLRHEKDNLKRMGGEENVNGETVMGGRFLNPDDAKRNLATVLVGCQDCDRCFGGCQSRQDYEVALVEAFPEGEMGELGLE